MNKKGYLLISLSAIFLAIIILNTTFVIAADVGSNGEEEPNLFASMSNPRMVLFKDIPEKGPLVFENSVIVTNKNDFSIIIDVNPTGVWIDRVTMEEDTHTLQPGERKEIPYTITIEEPGEYGGEIAVYFRDPSNPNSLSLLQRVVVHAEGESMRTSNPVGFVGVILWIIFVIVLAVILIVLILLLKKRNGRLKKNGVSKIKEKKEQKKDAKNKEVKKDEGKGKKKK